VADKKSRGVGVKKPGARNRIPLFDLKLSQQAKREVSNTLKSGWLTTGPKVADLEKAVADYLGMRYAVAVSSASAGLLLSLQAINVTAGQEVITTPFTFVATIEAILHCGAIPVLADIIPDTLGIDPDEVARKISNQTACILPVDIAGHPVDYERLCPLAAEHSIPLIFLGWLMPQSTRPIQPRISPAARVAWWSLGSNRSWKESDSCLVIA